MFNVPASVEIVSTMPPLPFEEDGDGDLPVFFARFQNSQIFSDLPAFLLYLPERQSDNIQSLIRQFPQLFSDTPTLTNGLCHDARPHAKKAASISCESH